MNGNGKERRGPVPPYIPFKTFLSFLDSLKVGVPSHIDRSVMRSMSGATQSGLMNALGYMRLVNEHDEPTETLSKLAKSTGDERRELLANLWGDTYANITTVDFDRTTIKQLDDALAGEGVSGATIPKSRAFLIAFAHTAGLSLSPYLRSSVTKTRTYTKRKAATKSQKTSRAADRKLQAPAEEKTPDQILFEILDPEHMEDFEQEAVWTLIKYLRRRSLECEQGEDGNDGE